MLSRYASRQLDRALAGHGLTLTQFQLMLTLWEEGPARVVALARRLRLDPGPTGRSLARLENEGIVSRLQQWRFSEWALHPDGVAHLEVLEPIWHDLDRSLRSEFGPDLISALVREVDRLPAWVPCEAGWLD
ncbi:MAG TPA: MarR family transcriptional regulator [Myxococcaceae bacterium]|nr:MarR family transcriptional regulator [Myxococcaceae bacterium]